LVDAGLPLPDLEADLAKLHLDGYALSAERVRRGGLAGTKVTVTVAAGAPRRGPREVEAIIDKSDLDEPVKRQALAVFHRLAEAEARVHGVPLERVHFHEVGAVDAMVDVVGTCAGFRRLGVGRVMASPVAVGRGTVRTEHGLLPVPAPATAELLTGVPVRGGEEEAELTTPTGAALLVTLAESFSAMPAMGVSRIGCGAGARENRTVPNLLRILIGQASEGQGADAMWVLETNLDDVTGEVCGYLFDRLFAAGAVDVFATPIQMKKNRPGVRISALSPPAAVPGVEATLFTETTTFGVRRYVVTRRTLEREHVEVVTEHGPVRIKVGRLDGEVTSAAPEYEDCRRIAEATGLALKAVYALAMEAFRRAGEAAGGSEA
jgi:uncharacterized protein (TIGR00299 family) protein